MRTIETKVYKFTGLSDEAKEAAIGEVDSKYTILEKMAYKKYILQQNGV